ncbi:MAG: integration host factor subunit alpha [Candidatus Yanofskybacteria bacterium CG10_big_fil_rev_8_21_14_0_10_36_16]|uniref:Integration host factor subunit alpha n=1 Tax=Candidatus Yanofskybacteria bacterium CG10_big_fil_rev_8_21_14_0_10_36_16 TaxID=1975096 RepID=A0A2J0Q812_9BACT|nr:MAG: integration host factor subunit alpha [Candidatus Yanofskybacteria bacterium CG10_big_fil_rev_8_21_14_0_10_36_16]
MPVKKNQFVQSLADKMSVTKKDANEWVDAFLDEVTKIMKSGDKIAFSGFGTFKVADRPARTGRNPRTGETIQIKASKKVKFLPAKALKEAVL